MKFNQDTGEKLKYLLSEEDTKIFGAKDFISHLVTFTYDENGGLREDVKESFLWNRPCTDCESGYVTIKTLKEGRRNTYAEIISQYRSDKAEETDNSTVDADKSRDSE